MRVVGCRYLAGRLVNGQRGICRSGFWEIKKKRKKKSVKLRSYTPLLNRMKKRRDKEKGKRTDRSISRRNNLQLVPFYMRT